MFPLYQDVLIALDESRQINNGQPSLWAFLLDQLDITAGEQVLHLGCGTGYYTAVMAELIGPTGKITAVEIDANLAEKARIALEPWPQITVSNADGSKLSFEPADLIVASAGATHPLPSWLDALKPGGRLLFTSPAEPIVWNDAMTGFESRSIGAEEYRRRLSAVGLSIISEYEDEGQNHYFDAVKDATAGARRADSLESK